MYYILCACYLQEFKAEHGHTNVPQEYPKNPSLGNWVKYNRYKMREWDNSGSNDELEKMTLLVEIGLRCYIGECVVMVCGRSFCGSSPANSLHMHVSMFR